MEEEKKSFLDEETQRVIFEYLFEDITNITEKGRNVIFERAISVIEKECDNTVNQVTKHYEKVIEDEKKNNNPVRVKLSNLYEHEKHLLDLLKDYKEEIKFAISLQTELRKEQANFFSSTLKEVCDSLKDEQISKECAKKWIEDLVASYTSSLKLSYQLTDENIMTSIGNIKEEINNTINQISN
ncbi:MAG: hypothetical protein UH542_09675 [Bacteroidales bacterium]|nr:hypothetical protein [Bacteroidales bacterium]